MLNDFSCQTAHLQIKMHQARVVLNEILEPFQGPISLLLPNSSMFSSFIELDLLENLIVGKLQIPKLLIIAYDIS